MNIAVEKVHVIDVRTGDEYDAYGLKVELADLEFKTRAEAVEVKRRVEEALAK